MHWSRFLLGALPLIACAQPGPLPDEACRPEFDRVAPQCGGSAALRECWRKRLSPDCFKEAAAGAAAVRSASCQKQLEQASGPCQEASTRCVAQKMSHGCKHTAAGFVEARKACDEAVQRVWQLCNPQPADQRAKCFQQQRGTANSACQ